MNATQATPEPLDDEAAIRARRSDGWNRMFPEPLTEAKRRFWTHRDGGYAGPIDQDGRPYGGPWPFPPKS